MGNFDPEKFYHCNHHKLDNGLELFLIEQPHLNTVAISLYIRGGSRFETVQSNGVLHFLEHMVFRGTQGYPDSYTLNRAFDLLGESLEGTSYRDCTVFDLHITPDGVKDALNLLLELVTSPTYPGIDIERNVLIEETLEYLDEDGINLDVDDVCKTLRWPDHPLGMTITGPVDNLNRFTVADLEACREAFYCAKNMVLAIAGPIDPRRVLGFCRRILKGIPPGQLAEHLPLFGPNPPLFEHVHNESSQTDLRLSFETVSGDDEHALPLLMLCDVLDEGMTSRIQRRICDEQGLAYDVSASTETYQDTGLFYLEGSVSHGSVGELLGEFAQLLDELKREPITVDERELVLARYRWELRSMVDDVQAMAHWFASTALYRTPERLGVRLKRMEALTADALQQAARRFFVPQRMAGATVGQVSTRQIREWRRELASQLESDP